MPVTDSIALNAESTGPSPVAPCSTTRPSLWTRRTTAEAIVNVLFNERSYRGAALHTNIIEASAHAFLEAINQILSSRSLARPAHAQLSADSSTVQANV